MDRIRLRFTGLTAYGATLLTTLTGLIFMVVITRRLTPEELGVWRYIGTLITYFIIPAGLLGFWATRFTASGEKVLKTLLTLAVSLSALSTCIFILLAPQLSALVDFPASVFIVAALEIPSIYLYMTLESVAHAKRPHVNYYAQLVQEALKIPIAAILVVILRLGLLGAIVAVVAAYAARAATIALYLKDLDWGNISSKLAKKMASVLWLPLYQSGAGAILALDTVVVVSFAGGPEPAGYAAAVHLLGGLVTMSGTLAAGLYPKMLQQTLGRDVETSIGLVLMLAIPTCIGLVILGAPLLNILRPEYSEAAQILPIAVSHAILFVFSGITDSVIAGSERVDFNSNMSFRDLLKSNLFLLPTLNYVLAAINLPALIISLIIFNPTDPLSVLTIWLTVNLASFIPVTTYKIKTAYHLVPFKFPTKSVLTYLAAASFMGAVAFFTKPEKLHGEVVPALTQTLPSIFTSVATYFALLVVINKEFRALVNAVRKTLT